MSQIKDIDSASRRHFLAKSVALGAIASASYPTLANEAFNSCLLPTAENELYIDVHCHIFNGEDVAVRAFVEQTILHVDGRAVADPRNWIGRIADGITRISSPTVQKEYSMINKFIAYKGIEPLCEEFHLGKKGSTKSIDQFGYSLSFPSFTPPSRPKPGLLTSWTNYRIYNALALMELYPAVKLFTPAMVDIDRAINGTSPVTLRLQVELMEIISVITRGRFHSYVAFDPLRQVEFELYSSHGINSGSNAIDISDNPFPLSPFGIVRDAIFNKGCIGVKLYPPIAFKAIDNENLASLKCKNFSRKIEGKDELLVSKYDEVLKRLYKWCETNDVPIIAHANDSNSAFDISDLESKCLKLGTVEEWSKVAECYPKLKINLGHFGRLDEHAERKIDAERLAKLPEWDEQRQEMDRRVREDGDEFKSLVEAIRRHENLYGDFANYTQLRDEKIRSKLASIFQSGFDRDTSIAVKKLMYGSDWHMNSGLDMDSESGESRRYFDWHKDFASKVSGDPMPASRFAPFEANYLGRNAAHFLGLKNGGNRQRLNRFYQKWGIDAKKSVPWVKPVDDAI